MSGTTSLLGGPTELLPGGPTELLPGGPLTLLPGNATTRAWIAQGETAVSASLPGNWSPTGVPIAGDLLTMTSGHMQVNGDDLAGDLLTLGTPGQTSTQTIDLRGQPTINIEQTGGTTISTLNVHDVTYATVKVDAGNHFLHFNLDPNASLQTNPTFDLTDASVYVVGGMAFLNPGTITMQGSALYIDSDLEGTGKIVVGADKGGSHAVFFKSVSTQTVEVAGNPSSNSPSDIQIDDPAAFAGSVTLDYGKVVLVGLGGDSYAFNNDMLSIYQGGSVVDTLKLASPSSYQGHATHLAVYATSNGVLLDNTGTGGSNGTLLGVHVGT